MHMLKQFFMWSITEASRKKLGNFHPSQHRGSGQFQVEKKRQQQFFSLICDKRKASTFLDKHYASHERDESHEGQETMTCAQGPKTMYLP